MNANDRNDRADAISAPTPPVVPPPVVTPPAGAKRDRGDVLVRRARERREIL